MRCWRRPLVVRLLRFDGRVGALSGKVRKQVVTPLDANTSRSRDGGPSFSRRNRVLRAVWIVVWAVFASWTPTVLHPWRRCLLRLFGARIDGKSDVRGSARVWYPPNLTMEANTILDHRVNCYNMAPILIKRNSIVSQGAFLCCGTHDYRRDDFQLVARPIVIQEGCWIAAEAFVGPGVTVGAGAVLGARAVALTDVEENSVYVGNPARKIKPRFSG